METVFDLKGDAGKKVLIAAHRGSMGGNIPGNTIDAFEAALFQGADMLELDVSKSTDGVLYVFHPGMEPITLRSMEFISRSHSSRVDQLRFLNADGAPTRHYILKFDEFLEQFKGRCYLNIDKFWMWMPDIAQAIRRHGMQEQVLVKTPAEDKYFDMVEQLAPDLPFMTIAKEKDEISDRLMGRRLRYAGIEALFTADDAPIASEEYIDQMHKKGLLVWGNAIVYSYLAVLSGGHNDDISVTGQPEIGWGWLAKRGFDIIQTDWVCPMLQYLERAGLREKK